MQKPENNPHNNPHNNPRRALGKGIGALLPTRAPVQPPVHVSAPQTPATTAPATPPQETPLHVSPDAIEPNPNQPRRVFDDAHLAELAQSIKAHGIIQPLIVQKKSGQHDQSHAGTYLLVAGERRWRAAKLAGLATVPVILADYTPDSLLEVALIENIQREDLNAIETAVAFQRMAVELNLSAEQIGVRTGKDRSTVINFMRLLQLPQDLQDLIATGKITAGHGRCLLSLTDSEQQRALAQQAMTGSWSVRALERACQKLIEGKPAKPDAEPKMDPNVKAAIQEMERKLGTRIHVKEGARGRGKLEIEYYSAEDLDRIYDAIMGE